MPQLKLLELVASCGELWRVVAGCGELWQVVKPQESTGVLQEAAVLERKQAKGRFEYCHEHEGLRFFHLRALVCGYDV